MVDLTCPTDAELLAWLHDPLDSDGPDSHTTHINNCPSCQRRLADLDDAEERHKAASGDNLLEDLRQQPPVDDLETEGERATEATRVRSVIDFEAVPKRVSGRPDASDVAALTQRGHYEILGVLGQGGMGVVYKARNLKMNRLVAIKVLPTLKPQTPDAVARFEREMKAVARLKHPHVVSAYDADEIDGKHFLVLEYIDGYDLKSLVKAQGPLPVNKAVDYILQAARGLQYAHAQGIVHRDVKPANLMLDRDGTVKVLDLGLARIESGAEGRSDLTETGVLMGTIDFLAPEQAISTRDIDGRADIYSLGCSLYFLLTGAPVYGGGSVIQQVVAHREQPIPSLRDICPGFPVLLEKVFEKMVAKRREDRFQTMAEVVRALENKDLLAGPSWTPGTGTAHAASGSETSVASRWRFGKPHRRRWLAGGAALVMVLAATALFFNHFPERNKPENTPYSRYLISPADGAVDLVPLVNVDDDTESGSWARTDDGLVMERLYVHALLALPVATTGSYRLKFEFSRLRGNEGPSAVFPVGFRHARFDLCNFPNAGGLTGIGNIKGLGLDESHQRAGTFTRDFVIENRKRYLVEIEVVLGTHQDVTIHATVDGRQLAVYEGPQAALSVPRKLFPRDQGVLGLAAFDTGLIFHFVRLEMIEGEAHILRR